MGGLCLLVYSLKLSVLISYEGGSDQQIFSGIFKFFTVFEKKVFRVFAISTLSDTISSFSVRLFFLLIYFPQAETVLQSVFKFLLSVTFFSFNFVKYCFIFEKRYAKFSLSPKVPLSFSLFLKHAFSMMHFLAMKGLLFL